MGINVKVINKSPYPLPEYKTEGSAGMDIRANITNPIKLFPHDRFLIPTGLYIQCPEGIFGGIYPRSGLALKVGLSNANGVGVIDKDYTGEIGIIVLNTSNDPITINPGDRIAQIIFQRYEKCSWLLVDELDKTERGSGGYGHTGIN